MSAVECSTAKEVERRMAAKSRVRRAKNFMTKVGEQERFVVMSKVDVVPLELMQWKLGVGKGWYMFYSLLKSARGLERDIETHSHLQNIDAATMNDIPMTCS